METKLSARAQVGQRWKVKRNPITKQYGVRTHGAWQAKGDDHAWPGEVGTVVEWTWTTTDGAPMSCLKLEFERGRAVSVDLADLCDFLIVSKPAKVR